MQDMRSDSPKEPSKRSLTNYKAQHEETARKKGVYEAFMAARTLTRARIILFGAKRKQRIR